MFSCMEQVKTKRPGQCRAPLQDDRKVAALVCALKSMPVTPAGCQVAVQLATAEHQACNGPAGPSSRPPEPMNSLQQVRISREHLPRVCLSPWHLLVVLSRDVKPPEEDVRIAQVAVRSPLGCLVPKLLRNSKALQQTQTNEYRLAITWFLLHSNFSGRLTSWFTKLRLPVR